MRILIADDDPVSRRLLEGTLVRLGHEVVAVADGSEALASLLDADGPRLAILDWMMPGADGLDVCRTLRRRETPYVYVILLTARDRHEDMLAGLDAEADDFLTKPFDKIELRARLRSGERVLGLQEKLREQATHDHLTGLWNRGVILEELDRELARAKRERRPLAVIMADIDLFKRINDTHGHQVGDTVLRQTADRMRSVLRTYDSIGRYGGEEFLIVLPGCNATEAGHVADRMRALVASAPHLAADLELHVTISLGVAWTPDACTDSTSLIKAADDALYRAKAAGRNRVEE